MNDCAVTDLPLEALIPRWNGTVWWSGIRPVLRRMLEVDLTLAELILLHGLQHHPLTIAEVANTLYITHSAASRAADRLVRDGLVKREENPADRRQKRLTLTDAGAALLDEMEALRAQRLTAVLASLSDDERERLRRLLARTLQAFLSSAEDDECPAPVKRGGDASKRASTAPAL